MTFEELTKNYLSLIQNVDAAEGNPEVYESQLAILALNMKPALRGTIPDEDLDRGAMMAAIELVSRYRHPEGWQDGYGFNNDNPDIMAGADEEATTVVVEILQPDADTLKTLADNTTRAVNKALKA